MSPSEEAVALRAPTPAQILAACRAHWPSFDRMRPDVSRKRMEQMTAALMAAMRVRA